MHIYEATTGKPVGDDLREGKPTPLLARAIRRASGALAGGATMSIRGAGCRAVSRSTRLPVRVPILPPAGCPARPLPTSTASQFPTMRLSRQPRFQNTVWMPFNVPRF